MNSLLSFLVSSAEGELTYETHHWLLPETAEIIYGGLASVLVIGALAKFAGPMIKKSLAARTVRIQADMDNARSTRETAEVEAGRIDAARQTVDTERNAQLAQVNARIAAARAEADQQTAAARAAAQGQVAAAVAQVATKAAQLASGRAPDAAVVQAAVTAAMESAGSR